MTDMDDPAALVAEARALVAKVLPADGGVPPVPPEPDVRFSYWQSVFLQCLDPGPPLLERLEGVALFSTYKRLAEIAARLADALQRQVTIYAEYGAISNGAIEDMRADRDTARDLAVSLENQVARLKDQRHIVAGHDGPLEACLYGICLHDLDVEPDSWS